MWRERAKGVRRLAARVWRGYCERWLVWSMAAVLVVAGVAGCAEKAAIQDAAEVAVGAAVGKVVEGVARELRKQGAETAYFLELEAGEGMNLTCVAAEEG